MGFDVVPKDILRGTGDITKENALSRIDKELGTACTRGSDPNATPKSPKSCKVITAASNGFKWGHSHVATGSGVFDPQVVIESIRPEAWAQVGPMQHGAYGIGHIEMGPLNRPILVGRIRASWSDRVVECFEEPANRRVAVEFTALIHEDVFPSARRGMGCQVPVEPVEWGSFGDTCVAMVVPGVMVDDQDVARFAIQANEVVRASLVTRTSTRKGEVHRQTLKLRSCRLGGVRTRWFFALFGLDTCGAAMEDGVMVFERRDTVDKFVGMVEVIVAGMTQPLVPEHPFSRCPNGVNGGLGVGEEPSGSKSWRRCGAKRGERGR
jgi:hypothetical protein